MTLGVIKSALADRDNVFSQALRKHAHSLDLTTTMPVGAWSFGQGIRKAHEKSFFWELSSKQFSPLGLHHPTALVNTDETNSSLMAPQPFAKDLVNAFPLLANWNWTLLEAKHDWLKQDWNASNAWLMEGDATLKSDLGWLGFSMLPHLQGWSVKLSDDVFWAASPNQLPPEGLVAGPERAQLRLFLSNDALGPEGRLQELRKLLLHTFPSAEVHGLNVVMSGHSAKHLAERGLSCDDIDGNSIRLCFPLSFLKEDLVGVAQLLSMKG